MSIDTEFKTLTVNYVNLFSSFVNAKRWYIFTFALGNFLSENHVRTEVRLVILFLVLVVAYDNFGKRAISFLSDRLGGKR